MTLPRELSTSFRPMNGGPLEAPKEAPKEPTKKEAAAIKAALFLSVRMSPALAREIVGRLQVSIPRPTDVGEHVIEVGSRLFLREWTGAPTGRADVVRVVDAGPTSLVVERTWGWHQGKIDDDLSSLGLTMIPNIFGKTGFE